MVTTKEILAKEQGQKLGYLVAKDQHKSNKLISGRSVAAAVSVDNFIGKCYTLALREDRDYLMMPASVMEKYQVGLFLGIKQYLNEKKYTVNSAFQRGFMGGLKPRR
jgi:hypothetical protein